MASENSASESSAAAERAKILGKKIVAFKNLWDNYEIIFFFPLFICVNNNETSTSLIE